LTKAAINKACLAVAIAFAWGAAAQVAEARAPAPPLTELTIHAVNSTNCGWENTTGKATTTCDHGGPMLRVAVLEIGYGSNRVAWMGGGLLPRTAMYESALVCISGGRYSWPCKPGQSAVGFVRYYKLDGQQSGLFQYQSTSTNAPYNKVSAQIMIR